MTAPLPGPVADVAGRRAAVPGLRTPDPLGGRLPGVYADDDLAQRLTAGFDTVLAPVQSTLDNLWAYFTPAVAPDDFVDWLGEWVGAAAGRDWPAAQRRHAVVNAVASHRIRGTAVGLRASLHDTFGVDAEIEESGGTSWSATPGGRLPGHEQPHLTVRIHAADPTPAFNDRVREFVEANRPAHVPCTVEILPAAAR